MPVYKVFTWNMQRAQSVSLAPAGRDDHGTLPGAEGPRRLGGFRLHHRARNRYPQNLNNFNLPGLNRNFCASQMVDNQTYASACRPVIYSAIREFVGPKRFRSYVSL